MTLAPQEFMRRFLIHVLPKGFHRIRHYATTGSWPTARAETTARARELLAVAAPEVETDNTATTDLAAL
jgi:Putative transposase